MTNICLVGIAPRLVCPSIDYVSWIIDRTILHIQLAHLHERDAARQLKGFGEDADIDHRDGLNVSFAILTWPILSTAIT